MRRIDYRGFTTVYAELYPHLYICNVACNLLYIIFFLTSIKNQNY